MAWAFTSSNSFTWNTSPPFDNAYTFDGDVSLSGEIIIPGSRAGLTDQNDYVSGIPAGQGRTMFDRDGFRVGYFNTVPGSALPEGQAVTTWDEVLEYNNSPPFDTQTTFTGQTAENIIATAGLTIFRSKLALSFSLSADIVGRLVTDYADPSTPDEDIEFTGANILWSASEDLDTTATGPFSTWELSLERDALDLDNEPTGTETLNLTVTVVAWGAA